MLLVSEQRGNGSYQMYLIIDVSTRERKPHKERPVTKSIMSVTTHTLKNKNILITVLVSSSLTH